MEATMTKAESESIYLAAILNDETREVEMTDMETCTFRVHVHRIKKEMEKKNHNLWLKTKQFGITRSGNITTISKAELRNFKMYRINAEGVRELVVLPSEDVEQVENVETVSVATTAAYDSVITLIEADDPLMSCGHCSDRNCPVKIKKMRELDKIDMSTTMDKIKLIVCSQWKDPE
jgi:predicted metal-binding protein